jgi:hypothetical protein
MHVQPLHALAPHADPAVALERRVPLLVDDRLLLGARERMRRGRGDREPLPLRGGGRGAAQQPQRLLGRGSVGAHARRRLEHGREQLGLQHTRKLDPRHTGEDPVDRRDLVERAGVEDHQLLLDAERERDALAERVWDHVAALTPCTGRPAATHA